MQSVPTCTRKVRDLQYKEDNNKKLWGILESNLVVNTHPYNHIVTYETSKDGQSAFFSSKCSLKVMTSSRGLKTLP